MRSRSLPGALLAIYHYYCLSVFLPYSCSGSEPSLPEPILLSPVRHWVTQGYVRSPLPDGSHRHHAWRLSTPCVDFVNPDKNGICVHENSPHAKYCFSSSLNVFAKAQVIVKAKHRFLVQDARYSSSALVDSHFSSYNCPADSRNSYIPCRENHQFIGSFYCTHR